jgi:hypothetical protein
MSNEAFEAAVRGRAAEYKKKQARRRHIFMTVCPLAACLALVVGIGMYKSRDTLRSASAQAPANFADAPNTGKDSTNKAKNEVAVQTKTIPAQENAAQAEQDGDSANRDIKGDSAERPSLNMDGEQITDEVQPFGTLRITLQETVIQQGAKTLNMMLTNRGGQSFTVSSVQFMLSRIYPDGNEVGFTHSLTANETSVTIEAGKTVPFAFDLNSFTEELPAGTYKLRLFESEVQFTIQ